MTAHSKRVLLIEDNPGDVDLVRLRLLERNSEREVPFEIVSADRLSTGLNALTKELPAVVLLDLYLPDSRGAETFHNVLSRAVGVPVVVLSAQDDEELVVKALQHGVQDYLVKGAFDSKQLGHTLRCAIERQALLTALGTHWKQPFEEQLLSHVSRELRAGLTAIDQSVTTLLHDSVTPVHLDQRVHLNAVLRSVNQLRSMIDRQQVAT